MSLAPPTTPNTTTYICYAIYKKSIWKMIDMVHMGNYRNKHYRKNKCLYDISTLYLKKTKLKHVHGRLPKDWVAG